MIVHRWANGTKISSKSNLLDYDGTIYKATDDKLEKVDHFDFTPFLKNCLHVTGIKEKLKYLFDSLPDNTSIPSVVGFSVQYDSIHMLYSALHIAKFHGYDPYDFFNITMELGEQADTNKLEAKINDYKNEELKYFKKQKFKVYNYQKEFYINENNEVLFKDNPNYVEYQDDFCKLCFRGVKCEEHVSSPIYVWRVDKHERKIRELTENKFQRIIDVLNKNNISLSEKSINKIRNQVVQRRDNIDMSTNSTIRIPNTILDQFDYFNKANEYDCDSYDNSNYLTLLENILDSYNYDNNKELINIVGHYCISFKDLPQSLQEKLSNECENRKAKALKAISDINDWESFMSHYLNHTDHWMFRHTFKWIYPNYVIQIEKAESPHDNGSRLLNDWSTNYEIAVILFFLLQEGWVKDDMTFYCPNT